MPYKRSLRLLWVAFDHAQWAREACAGAAQLSSGRIAHRAADSALEPEALQWADLILTVDRAARDGLPPLPSRVQLRHLDLEAAADSGARQALVEARVAGILGGLRLLERGGD